MKKNIFISAVLSASFLLSPLPTHAEDFNESFEATLTVSRLEDSKPHEIVIEGEGSVPIDDIVNDLPMLFSMESAPSYYNSADSGIITSPKNQNPYGTCWSFSTTSAMETSMIKNGYARLGEVDYSELHLAYFAHTRNSFTGDGENVYSQSYGYYGGGSTIIAAQVLAGWQGMADEEDFPYPPKSKDYTLPESARYKSVAHLQDYYILNAGSVKKAIMEHGSVVASYYDENQYFSGNSYYRGIDGNQTNHAITIVGWDDNYALANFDGLTNKPKNPGAWIVKNSWGDNWGDEGYFYMSYEEPSLANFVAYNAEPADNYDIIYQYDGSTNKLTLNASKYANIYEASENQKLEAIGLYTSFPYTEYTVEIYKLNENHTSPEDGVKMGTLEGFQEFVGFHTLEFENPISLSKDDKFSVVCSLSGLYNMSTVSYAPFEGSTAYDGLDNSSNEGESFCYTNGWFDTYNQEVSNMLVNNAAVKAYSSYDLTTVALKDGDEIISEIPAFLGSYLDIPENPEKDDFYFAGWYKDEELLTPWNFDDDTVSENTILYAKWSENPIPVEAITLESKSDGVLVGDTLKISATVSPYYASDKALSWTSSDKSVIAVENGLVTGLKKGTATVRVASHNGISEDFAVTVYNPMTSVHLGLKKPIFATDDIIEVSILCPEAKYFNIYFQMPDKTCYYLGNIENSTDGSAKNIGLKPLPANNYTVWVEAEDYLGNTLESAKKTMRITDDLVLTASKTPTGFIAGGYNNNSLGVLICAYYDDSDNFISAVKLANSEYPPANFPTIAGAKTVKFMWWDSILGMNAITTSMVLNN